MIKKIVFRAAVLFGAALAVATPVRADPSLFGPLGCNCAQPTDGPQGKLTVKDQVNRGIESGLGSVHGGPPNVGDF